MPTCQNCPAAQTFGNLGSFGILAMNTVSLHARQHPAHDHRTAANRPAVPGRRRRPRHPDFVAGAVAVGRAGARRGDVRRLRARAAGDGAARSSRSANSGATTRICAACATRMPTLRSRVADLEIRLQEQRALAQRSGQLQALLDLRPFVSAPTLAADVIAGYVNPGILTVTIDKGSSDGVMAEHGGDLLGRRRRPGDRPGGGARRAGAAAHRPQRAGGGRGADRADPGRRHGGRQGGRPAAAHGFRLEPGRREAGRRGGHVGRRRHLSPGLPHRLGRDVGARRRPVAGDHRAAVGGFPGAGRGAGGAPRAARRDPRGRRRSRAGRPDEDSRGAAGAHRGAGGADHACRG